MCILNRLCNLIPTSCTYLRWICQLHLGPLIFNASSDHQFKVQAKEKIVEEEKKIMAPIEQVC